MVSTVTGAMPRDPGPDTVHLPTGVVSPFAIAKTSLRCGYDGTDALLAHLASNGGLTVDQLTELAARRPSAGDLPAGLAASAVSALASWVVGRSLEADAIQRSADLFDLARLLARRDGRTPEHPNLDLQVSLAAGRLDDRAVKTRLGTPGLDPWVAWAARADRANPFPAADPTALDAWYDVFDEPFTARGISPVRIGDAAAPFPSLTTTRGGSDASTVEGPLVSIVVPVHANGDDLLTAVDSLVHQTWRNLQIILVDDASPEEHRHVLDAALALDPRIELVRMPVNGGAYKARNAGIARARGEVVGIQDADDWSHPERIARQMALMAAEPGLVATLSKAIRLHTDLRITKVGALPYERNLPSLLFRREAVLARLGRFDDVRKAADGEFVERLVATFGRDAVRTLEEPLALYQLTDDSLSRGDFRIGWHRHTRVSYRSAYRHWHRQIASGAADPLLDDASARPFPAPPELVGAAGPARFDVVVLADTRGGSASAAGLAAQLAALARSGLSVGLARSEPLRLAADRRTYPAPEVAAAVAAGHASWTSLAVDVATDLLLVTDPDLLAVVRTPGTVLLRPDRVVVTADHVPAGSYDPAAVERNALAQLGRDVDWLPAGDVVATALARARAAGHVHRPGLVEVVGPVSRLARPTIGRPVLGVDNSSVHRAERVDRAELLARLPRDDDHDVRLRQRSRHSLDPHWMAFAPDDVTSTELFDQCDFVIGVPPAGSFVLRPVLEAMSRGCVPVVHESYRPVLGEVALYYGAQTIAQVVDDCWSRPQELRMRREVARTFCTDHASADALISTITSLRSTEPAS